MDKFFDLKGYTIRNDATARITRGIAENEIDFAVFPSDRLDLYERGEVLWSCCGDNLGHQESRHGWNSSIDLVDLLRRAEVKGAKLDYVIIASPKVFEMGYKYRNNMYNAAEGSAIQLSE